MSSAMVRALLATTLLAALTACGGSSTEPTIPPSTVPSDKPSASTPAVEAPVADACSLLDSAYLTTALKGVAKSFDGKPLEFREPLQTTPSAYCEWKDGSGAFSIRLTVEDAKVSSIDDHSERTYNIDEEPTVKPQDGPGSNAVLLLDTAFVSSGSDPLAYGYFFVEGEVTVFIQAVGLELGNQGLRTLADEAHDRLTAA